jgi:hypothetical protein
VRNVYKILVGEVDDKKPLERTERRLTNILNWIPKKKDVTLGTGFSWFRIGSSCGLS